MYAPCSPCGIVFVVLNLILLLRLQRQPDPRLLLSGPDIPVQHVSDPGARGHQGGRGRAEVLLSAARWRSGIQEGEYTDGEVPCRYFGAGRLVSALSLVPLGRLPKTAA